MTQYKTLLESYDFLYSIGYAKMRSNDDGMWMARKNRKMYVIIFNCENRCWILLFFQHCSSRLSNVSYFNMYININLYCDYRIKLNHHILIFLYVIEEPKWKIWRQYGSRRWWLYSWRYSWLRNKVSNYFLNAFS